MSKVGRAIDGILLVNKPKGLTSNAVLQRVKHLFGARKAGHTGSLDPIATGMLPICFGEATKFSQYLLDADKCYEVTGCLGIKTNTSDATGQTIATVIDFVVTKDQLQEVLKEFTGQISQVPSMFSALKHNGTPLYKFARKGIEIERAAREISIHHLQLDYFDGKTIKLKVTCSKGTYIRNLIEDIGERLGVGAHVVELHRVHTAGFANDTMFTLEELSMMSFEALMVNILPMERAIVSLPKIQLTMMDAEALRQGKELNAVPLHGVSGCVRLYQEDGHFIGLGEAQASGILKVKRLLAQNFS